MNPKVVRLSDAINKFENSKRTVKDYLDLMVTVRYVLAPADGLTWGTVEETLVRIIGSKDVTKFTL